MKKIIAIIPARYQSSRFPGKPLVLICGKPMIQWVYENTSKVKRISETYVATDDDRIRECVEAFGGKCIMTSNKHESGTDRVAECANILGLDKKDIVLNIQGDEPLIKEQMILDLISTVIDGNEMGTLKELIKNAEDIDNPNIVKVITDNMDNAIYFSRYPIPYNRSADTDICYYRHVGVYAFRVDFLKKFTSMQRGIYEKTECLEQLRTLENGYKICVKETQNSSFGVDIPEQIAQIELLLGE